MNDPEPRIVTNPELSPADSEQEYDELPSEHEPRTPPHGPRSTSDSTKTMPQDDADDVPVLLWPVFDIPPERPPLPLTP